MAGGAGGVSHGKGQRTAPAAPRPPRRPYGEREAQGEAEALWEPEEGTLPLSGAVGTGVPAVTWGVEVCLRNKWVRHPAPRGEIGGRGVSPLAPIWWPRQGWGPLALIKGGGLASPLRPIVLRPARGLDVGQLLAALPREATGPGVKEGVGRDGTGCGVWSGRRGGPPGTRRAACGSGLWSSVGFAAACGAARSRDPETGGGESHVGETHGKPAGLRGAGPCAETPPGRQLPYSLSSPRYGTACHWLPVVRWTYLGQQQSEVPGRLCSGPAQLDGWEKKWPWDTWRAARCLVQVEPADGAAHQLAAGHPGSRRPFPPKGSGGQSPRRAQRHLLVHRGAWHRLLPLLPAEPPGALPPALRSPLGVRRATGPLLSGPLDRSSDP